MPIWGMGTDIAEIARFDNKQLQRMAERILTPDERATFSESSFPHRFLAKRFAAKEAAAKALGTGIAQGITFQDFQVNNKASGQPYLILTGKANEMAKINNLVHWHLSISDEKHYAVATVIIETVTIETE